MLHEHYHKTASDAWQFQLERLLQSEHRQAPRGLPCRREHHATLAIDMRYPNVCVPARHLSYVFMAAEALWILSGSDKVKDIAPYNKQISQFSDDGQVFAGAYGPKVVDQLEYVVSCLGRDRDSRQAVLNIWRENPGPSKDIPCTLSLTFEIAEAVYKDRIFDVLNCHAFMRSSDIWLGLPYDLFNFSMIAAKVAWLYNGLMRKGGVKHLQLSLGTLFWTAVNSHLYEKDVEDAKRCVYPAVNLHAEATRLRYTQLEMHLAGGPYEPIQPFPEHLLRQRDGWAKIEHALKVCRDREDELIHTDWVIRPKKLYANKSVQSPKAAPAGG